MAIQIPLTPQQFAKAQATLNVTGNSGHVSTHDVDFDYSYDGTSIMLTITARHTLKAKLASDDEIKNHIDGLLA